MLVSIIIPDYNRPEELKRAVTSALNQTIKDLEVIVVDDCSTLDIKSTLPQDPRIVYRRLHSKGNANVCRNEGLKLAKGEFVAMLDSDDEWLPTHLEKKIEFLTANKLDGVFSGFLINDGSGELKKRNIRPLNDNEKMVNYILDGNTAATPTHLYYTDRARQIMWDEKLLRHQDFDFSVRFGNKFRFEPDFIFSCIVHWKKNEKRVEHLESQIAFIERNKKDISPKLLTVYARDIYSQLILRTDVKKDTLKYFSNNFLRNPHLITLNDYLSVFSRGRSGLYRFWLRIKFLFLVLTS